MTSIYRQTSPEDPTSYGSIYNFADVVTFEDGSFAVAWSAFSHSGGYQKAFLQFFNKFGDAAGEKHLILDNYQNWEQATDIQHICWIDS